MEQLSFHFDLSTQSLMMGCNMVLGVSYMLSIFVVH